MNVKLATQLLTQSTADSIEFLMNKGFADFKDAKPNIDFCRMYDNLFDIFNSKSDEHRKPLKRSLCKANKDQIYKIFESAISTIKQYEIIQDGIRMNVLMSRKQTGFRGFIINMVSLKSIFEEFVEEKGWLDSIPTYHLSQDPLEIFFGKIRSLCGCNTNPSCQHFQSAYRKLLVYNTVCTSKKSNVYNYEISSMPFSNILFTSSRRATIDPGTVDDDYDDIPLPEDLEELHFMIDDIQQQERCSFIDHDLVDISSAYIAKTIEERICRPGRMYCNTCAKVFLQNEKLKGMLTNSKFEVPCTSTYCVEQCRLDVRW